MKKTITILCLIIVFAVLIFKTKNITNNKENSLIIGNTTYALTIDGVEKATLPTTGSYYLKSYNCENGSTITWDNKEKELSIKNINVSKEKCNLEFTSKMLLSDVEIGNYVAYEGNNGCLKGKKDNTPILTIGSQNAESGNSCLGYNARQASDSSGYYGYCNNSEAKGMGRFYVYGWRIAYIEDGNVYLISAGSPECRVRTESYENEKQITDLNTAALKYCNATYADGGTCSSDNTWAMGNYDFQKITSAISGTESTLTSYYGSNSCDKVTTEKRCGFNNDLIDNGGYYYFAARSGYSESTNAVYWNPYNYGDGSRFVNSNSYTEPFGFRPVIKLSSAVYITGGIGTMEDPYKIGI